MDPAGSPERPIGELFPKAKDFGVTKVLDMLIFLPTTLSISQWFFNQVLAASLPAKACFGRIFKNH